MADGYDANKSQVSHNALAEFLQNPVDNNDLESVPGIGPGAVELLKDAGITCTYQLIGQYLFLCTKNNKAKEHNDEMWYWLKQGGIRSHRSGIVMSLAEKCETVFPMLFASTQQEEVEDEA